MKNIFTLLISLIFGLGFFNQNAFAQGEVGEPNALQTFVNFGSKKDPTVIWGGKTEYEAVPYLLQSYFKDSDCKFEGGTPFAALLPFLTPDKVAGSPGSGQKSSGLICRTQYGDKEGGSAFQLCTTPGIECNDSSVGGIKKSNAIFVVPKGQRCDSVSAREALLSSIQSNYGGFSGYRN